MQSDHLEKLNRDLLMQKLKSAKEIIETSMSMKKLNRNNTVAELWQGIDEFISVLRAAKYESRKTLDFTHFLSDIQAEHVEHIQRAIVMTVMGQDHVQMEDKIEWLIRSIDWRINSFDDYWDQMKEGIIKNPYLEE